MDKVYSTLDVYVSSWIYLSTGTYPELRIHKGKVSFNFPLSDQLINSISEYNSGKKIEALKFSVTIKNFKSQIFQIKENGQW